MTDLLLRADAGPVARLTMNAPATLNALSDEMLAALKDAFAALMTDTRIRVVILSGAGRAFCAGHDLRQMQAARSAHDGGAAAFADLFARCAEVMQMILTLPQPVIAEVHGIATAAGCQLAASCDMVVAADNARFGVNGVNIGLFCSTPMVALSRAIPPRAAFEMLVTGAFIPAARAQELGLVNRIAPPEALGLATDELAATIAGKLTAVVRIGKRAFHAQKDLALSEAYRLTGDVMVANMLMRDTEEGIAAFLEKRPPDWPPA